MRELDLDTLLFFDGHQDTLDRKTVLPKSSSWLV